YAALTRRSYSSGDPENAPPSRIVRHVRIPGRGSSARSRAGGIGESARSIRYSIALASFGTRATRRSDSAASFGAGGATRAGTGCFLAIKGKPPGAGGLCPPSGSAPAERIGGAPAALRGCLPPPPGAVGTLRRHEEGIIRPPAPGVKAPRSEPEW